MLFQVSPQVVSQYSADQLLSANQVKALIGKRHTWLYEAIKTGAFPKPRKIGRNNSWPASEVYAWMAALPRAA